MTTFLVGASCKKESKADHGAVLAADNAKKPVDRTPIPKIDISGLNEKQQTTFYQLVDTFSSPCGKGHSLRTSVNTDPGCKEGPFAVRYLAKLISDDIPEKNLREWWEARYKDWDPRVDKRARPRLDGAPHVGPSDAPVKIVEYFDFGCPACQMYKLVVDEVVARNASGVLAVYYKQFPLTDIHPSSMSAAQAALAAHAQGKYKEMHDTLFAHPKEHERDDVMRFARDLGLDMARFEADYDAAEAQVRADLAEGDANGVDQTPTFFINGRPMAAPPSPDYFQFWIDEELALNRG